MPARVNLEVMCKVMVRDAITEFRVTTDNQMQKFFEPWLDQALKAGGVVRDIGYEIKTTRVAMLGVGRTRSWRIDTPTMGRFVFEMERTA